VNQLTITGRLTQDPELRQLPNGGQVCAMRVAVDGMSPGRETGYINVSSFGESGRAAAEQLTKGWLVAVQGRLEHHRWQTAEGQKRHDYGVVGHVEFLAAPRGGEARERESAQDTERSGEHDEESERSAPALGSDPRHPGAALSTEAGLQERQQAAPPSAGWDASGWRRGGVEQRTGLVR
jgi:single-strand DNA-binding protein